MRPAEQVELGQDPGADGGVVIRRPGGTHGHDRVEVHRVRELGVNVRCVESLGLDHLVDGQLVSAFSKPFPDRSGRGEMVVLNY